MHKGDIINGYLILRDATATGGGLCEWSFAKKGEKEYFIKKFLSPTYPIEGSPGSETTKQKKREDCQTFELHHQEIMNAVRGKSVSGGNLVVATDFFRSGAKYYKVTDKVDVATLKIVDILKLSIEQQLLLLKTVAHSLRILHQVKIVHGDLKPDNILIKKISDKNFTTKLIDFDNSYFAGNPPIDTERVVGDMVYYSPELGNYVQREKHVTPSDLGVKSDIFALGIIYCQYLTGDLPHFDKEEYKYPYVAVNAGQKLVIPKDRLPPKLVALINAMLLPNISERPFIDDVFNKLKDSALFDTSDSSPKPVPVLKIPLGLRPKPGDTPSAGTSEPTSSSSGLKGKLKSDLPHSKPTITLDSKGVTETSPKLRGRLLGKS